MWRGPSGNTVNDIFMLTKKQSSLGSKVEVSQILIKDFPKLGPDLKA